MKPGDIVKFSGFCLCQDELGQTMWEMTSAERSGIILEILDRKIKVYASGKMYLLNKGNLSGCGESQIQHIQIVNLILAVFIDC